MSAVNKPQIDIWNGRVGAKWAEMQVPLDAWVAPATAELKRRAGPVSGLRVLDIGCGNGETCLAWLEGGATVTGIDVSTPMLAVAARRTRGRAALVQADAAEWRADAPFDLAVSQFGLMFFVDPDAAFANIAANVRPGGRLLFTCWRAATENQWVSKPLGAIRELLRAGEPDLPGAAGPFAFSDRQRVNDIVERSGFSGVSIQPFAFPVCFATVGGLDAAVRFAMQIGPTAAALAGAGPDTKAAASQRLGAALAAHEQGGHVALGGAIWIVEAVRRR